MNISNSQNTQDQANNANIRPDCPDHSEHSEHQNPSPRNADHSRDNQSSDSSDTDSIGHWDSNWQNKKCTACRFRSHTYYNCEKKRKGELYYKRCNRYTHCDATCSRQRNSSTPRFQHQGHHSPRPDNHTVPPAEPSYNNYNNYNNYNTRPSPAPSSTGSTALQFMTFLDESRQQSKLLEYRKELLANIPIFDGKDKKACLMWLSQCAHTAVNTKMTLKEVLVAKGGPIVSTQVQIFTSKTPDATDAELKQHILESFSNVGSRTEAHHYLTRMTVDEDESLLAHNSEYAAVHEAALTKEAYAIYMSVKKLSFYLDSARITVRSDHLPLKKFLEKNTMNAKVNNWAVELESQKIDFVFIPGIKNVLADTLSRLIEVDNDVKLPEEKEGEEFGYIPFEKLPPAQVEVCEEVWINEVTQDRVTLKLQDPIQQNIEINLPLTNQKMKELQEQDPKVSHLRKLWSESKLNKTLFTMENDILKRVLMVNGLLYKPVVTPSILKDCLIMLAHNEQGHNGFKRTYGSLQTVYYWKGMKRQI